MSKDKVNQAAERAMRLEAELEVSSEAATGGEALARKKAVLHAWVETVTGVVAAPGVGRVVLIHADGNTSGIASSQLPMLLSDPVRWD